MFVLQSAILAAALAIAASQGPTTTPVPILKQLNRLNDDGSYSYGYEAADGSFKIETKYPDGEVAGKYGYIDESGKLKEISYGASKQLGFVPAGEGIVVPPAHAASKHAPINALPPGQEDDGQYREDPSIYEDPKYNSKNRQPGATPSANFQFTSQPQNNRFTAVTQPRPAQQQYYQSQPQPQSNYVHNPSNYLSEQSSLQNQAPQQFQDFRSFSGFPSQQYNSFPQFDSFPTQTYQPQQPQPQQYQQQQPQPQQYQQPQYQPQQYQQQQYQSQPQNYHHPYLTTAPNSLGSYSINYVGKK